MVAEWEPGTQYNIGDVVFYQGLLDLCALSEPWLTMRTGHQYKIIQPHRSQSDWTPDVTPALWGRMIEEAPQYGGYQPTYDQQPQQPIQERPPYEQQPSTYKHQRN